MCTRAGIEGTVREYIWLTETEIAPTMGSRTTVDRPLAVVDAAGTSPAIWFVHVDHLNRPVKMTDGSKAVVWSAVWTPWGAPQSLTGSATLNARFPGQWFQVEAGLHYNWHRHYDPTLGRYTQTDPLGFVDGPSVFAYAGLSPFLAVDVYGLEVASSELYKIYTTPPGIKLTPAQAEFVLTTLTLALPVAKCIPYINANRYLRLGPGRKGGSMVFRAAGSVIERITGRKHIDFFTIRKRL